MPLKKVLHCLLASTGLLAAKVSFGGELDVAANAINALGLDLLPCVAEPEENVVFSPYSIQSVLVMTYAGADGETKAEMAKVLHYPADEASLHRAFDAFLIELNAVRLRSAEVVEKSSDRGGPSEPISLEVANRLYVQVGYAFRPEFLTKTKDWHRASFQSVISGVMRKMCAVRSTSGCRSRRASGFAM